MKISYLFYNEYLLKLQVILKKGCEMSVTKIKDNNGYDYVITDIDSFYLHIQEYHSSGTSIHEENGHYFTVDDAFRTKIEALYRNHT